MGDSILLSATTDKWADRRKSLSTAFYKEKLLKMLELVKNSMNEKIG